LKLSPDVQRCLEEAAYEAGQYCTQVVREKTEADLIGLSKASGLLIIHPDKKLWRSRFDAAIRQICPGKLLPPGQYEAIQNL
jgi:TRAP-type C4-dicarboxylate transport system substrate-binding protein